VQVHNVGINPDRVVRIPAQFSPSNGAIGCANSHAFALSRFLFESDSPSCLILEDDFYCDDPSSFNNGLRKIITAEFEWDVVLFASNVAVPIELSQTPNLFRVANAQTTSAYMVNRKFAPCLIKLFYECAETMSENTIGLNSAVFKHLSAIDIRWKELQIHEKFYAFLPPLSRQGESHSDIENKLTSYGV
jgi:GR25 family glycosyltransferase involved in LPS biosynthesis